MQIIPAPFLWDFDLTTSISLGLATRIVPADSIDQYQIVQSDPGPTLLPDADDQTHLQKQGKSCLNEFDKILFTKQYI